MEKLCEVCEKPFSVANYLKDVRRHCSAECKHQSTRVALTCKVCSKQWWTWKSQVNIKGRPGAGQFCSKSCADTAKRQASPPKPPKRQPSNIVKVCEVCSETFRVYPSRVETARFCSLACKGSSAEYRMKCSEQQQEDKHWRWAGGTYKQHSGYVRIKRNKNGEQSIRFEHTQVMIDWMLEVDPEHVFLIVVDGKVRLQPGLEVHHIDRVRSNNTRENLLVVTAEAHAQIHHRGTKPKPWECWPSNPDRW